MLGVPDVQGQAKQQAVDRAEAHVAGAAKLEQDVVVGALEGPASQGAGARPVQGAQGREGGAQAGARGLEQVGGGDLVPVLLEARGVVALGVKLAPQGLDDGRGGRHELAAVDVGQAQVDEPHVAVQAAGVHGQGGRQEPHLGHDGLHRAPGEQAEHGEPEPAPGRREVGAAVGVDPGQGARAQGVVGGDLQ